MLFEEMMRDEYKAGRAAGEETEKIAAIYNATHDAEEA